MSRVLMPKLSDSMSDGTIVAWLLKEGAEVRAGDELVEIETDKSTMIYESEFSGTLNILVPDGELARVGDPIADIGDASGPGALPERSGSRATDPVHSNGSTATGGGKATPVARRIARTAGLDLSLVVGSGPGGRIRKRDVEAAIERGTTAVAAAPAPATSNGDRFQRERSGDGSVVELSAIERRMADRMVESHSTIPDFSVEMEVDCRQLVDSVAAFKEACDPAPTVNDFLVKATATALTHHPRVNGRLIDDRIEIPARVNVGVAVASERGLFVPTVFDADLAGLSEIARRTREMAGAVRDGSISPEDLSGGTFTISNLGMLGVTRFTAVVNPPQSAILAAGTMREKLQLDGERVVSIPVMDLTLCCDHRVLDGAAAAGFLGTIRRTLEAPALMAL